MISYGRELNEIKGVEEERERSDSWLSEDWEEEMQFFTLLITKDNILSISSI